MRLLVHTALCAMLSTAIGCAPTENGGDVLSTTLGLASGATAPSTNSDGNGNAGTVVASGGSAAQTSRITGSVSSGADYELTGLGGGVAGEHLIISASSSVDPHAFIVVLLDQNNDLIMRGIVGGSSRVAHTLRHDSSAIYLGVMAVGGSSGGKYDLSVDRVGTVEIPPPQAQFVYLNFAGAQEVRVNRRSPITFGPFNAGELGASYAGASKTIKDGIVSHMREDYAHYAVTIYSSDDGPPPSGPYATLHFGGDDDGLLGLADNVDMYNVDPGQTAVIYVDAFAAYEVMGLDADQMATMIGNVGSHELGHLLGLFHTRNPIDVMDTTGSAWDLAVDQNFARVELEASVFPTGMGNSPLLLADGVGLRPGGETTPAPKLSTAKALKRARARQLAQMEISHLCGTCLHLDD